MTAYDVLVEVRLRSGIADPQGSTIERSLPALGFEGISDVSVGKAIRFKVEASGEDEARKRADEVARQFLSNPVIEDSSITVTSS